LHMNKEVLSYNNIRVGISAKDWDAAIRASANVLLEEGSITQDYIEEIIKTVHDLGPYMAIMPGFILAHAAPSASVLKNSAALITLSSSINIGSENDPISVILCISCTDHDSHVDKLKVIAEILMRDGMIETLASARNAQQIYQQFNA